MPFNSTIRPRNGQKRRQKAPTSAQCAPTPRNQARAVSWATCLKIRFRGYVFHPQTPTFCGFQASESPNETPRPPYQCSLGGAGGQPGPRTARANSGSTRVPGAKKIIFSKVVPRPLGMLKQVFLAHFEPVVMRFEPWKIPKCLENGPFWDQKWVKNGSKTCFSKSDLGPFGMLTQVFLAHFEPVVTCFRPWKIPKCLENWPFWDQKWVKNGSKTRFSKSDLGPFGMLTQVFLAHFEPVVTCFRPWKIPKCLENGPFWDQKWVKNGSKTRFSKSDLGPFGMLTQVFLAHFEPVVTCFRPWKIPKCLENWPFWDQKWVKNGSETRFFKIDPGPFGMLKQVFLAHFEPIWTGFGPWKSQYSLKRGCFGSKNG